jgi:hypothetical protein
VTAFVFIALSCAAPAQASLPREGILVPGQSLGGIQLGATKAQVRHVWGSHYGRCRGCFRETWYFTYRPFEPQGAGVVFQGGKVVRVFTIWQPPGWHTPGGLTLGVPEAELTGRYGSLVRRTCLRYTARVLPGKRASSTFYVYAGVVWGFGLIRPEESPCQ